MLSMGPFIFINVLISFIMYRISILIMRSRKIYLLPNHNDIHNKFSFVNVLLLGYVFLCFTSFQLFISTIKLQKTKQIVIKMNTLVLFILSALCLNCWSWSSEMRDRELLLQIQAFHNYLKSIQTSELFANTKVGSDIQQYKAGLGNEDIHLNISQLIFKYGYKVEEHEVTTEDGYILTLIRIRSEGPVVFLMHGLVMSADDWVTAGTESGIAYLLANEGYDVWMGNARGSKHSRRHKTLAPSSQKFWDFSWDEIGRYDLPVMIDYVLDIRNQTKLIYVGHSQGCTSFLVMCSEILAYNDKISLMVALSAPAAIPNMKSPIFNFLKVVTLFHPELLFSLFKELGIYEFLPSENITAPFRQTICGTEELAKIVCSNIVFSFCGFDAAQLNVTNLPVVFAHTPSGAATKQFEHYSQSLISGRFRRFDFGPAKNYEMYRSLIPPEYPVERITVPIALFYSENDWLVDVKDVENLRRRLRNVVEYYKVPNKNFNHVDYLFALDLKQLVFSKMSSVIKYHLLH